MHEYYLAPAISRVGLRDLASIFRNALTIDSDRAFPVVEVLEFGLPVLFPGFEYEIVETRELRNKYADTDIKNKRIFIREDVYDGAMKDNHRDRFTIAHEFGHLLIHKDENVSVRYLARKEDTKTIPAYRSVEWQANTFAGELLVPHSQIKSLDITFENIRKVSEKFKVSSECARIQLSNK